MPERGKFESPYTPSGLAVWIVIGELARNLGDEELTMKGVLRGAIFEDDVLYAKRYFEKHPERVISKLEAESIAMKKSLKIPSTHP